MELSNEPFRKEALILEENFFVVKLGEVVPGWNQFH